MRKLKFGFIVVFVLLLALTCAAGALAAAQNADADAEKLFAEGEKFYADQNYSAAQTSFAKAAEQGHARAAVYLASMYENGRGVTKDEAKAVEYYKMAARLGDELARGNLSKRGITNYDAAPARNGGKNAAGQKQTAETPPAANDTKKLIEEGFAAYLVKDYAKALDLFSRAADQGNSYAPYAQFNLGWMYNEGEGVPQNYSKAVELYKLAAAKKHALALNNLAYMYDHGHGVPENDSKAIGFLRLAAGQGNESAEDVLYSVTKTRVTDSDRKNWASNFDADFRALIAQPDSQPYTAAAQQLPADDASKLADEGEAAFNAKDYTKALDLLSRAADQGNADALYRLGTMYARSIGVPKNDSRAAELYKLAADQGHTDAQYSLDWMYANGRATPAAKADDASKLADEGEAAYRAKDYKKALDLLSRAADQENARAQFWLGRMYDKGEGVPQNYSKAVEFYKSAAAEKHAFALNNLGVRYYNGEGVPKDKSKAFGLWRLAAGQGNELAEDNLYKMTKTRVTDSDRVNWASNFDADFRALTSDGGYYASSGGNSNSSGGGSASATDDKINAAVLRGLEKYLDSALAKAGVSLPGGASALISGSGGEAAFNQYLNSALSQAGIDHSEIASLFSGENENKYVGERIFSQYLDSALAQAGVNLPGGFSSLFSGSGEQMFNQALTSALSQSGIDIPGLGGLLSGSPEAIIESAITEAVTDSIFDAIF